MKKTIIIVATIVVAIGAMGWTLASNKNEIESRKEVKTTSQDITVTIAKAEMKETAGELQLVGTAEANREVMIASESSGKITQINFKLGDHVSKGAILASVDNTYKRLAYENALLSYNKYKDDYERYLVLRKGDAISETQLRDMKLAYENADIQLQNAKKQLDDTHIIAPFSGYITSKNVELGTYVNAGTSIAGVVDIEQLKVSLNVSESNVYEMKKGQEVVVCTSIYPDICYKGVISNISPKGNSAHTYPVEVMIANNSKNPLKAGTYVNVHVDMGKAKPALMIPRDAIVSSVKDPSVYVVKGETAQLVKISKGRDYKSDLEVLSGISEGDMVVTNGQINLMDGAKVQVVNN